MNWYRLEFLKQSNRHLPGDFSSDDDDYQSLNKRKDEEELSDEYVWLFYRDKLHVDKRYESVCLFDSGNISKTQLKLFASRDYLNCFPF